MGLILTSRGPLQWTKHAFWGQWGDLPIFLKYGHENRPFFSRDESPKIFLHIDGP
jgi:hypothetical protein